MISRILSRRARARTRQTLEDLIGHCWKKLRRDSDMLSERQETLFRREIQKADNALHADTPDLERTGEALVSAYQRCFPSEKSSAWRENGEVILVALVVAMAVRAFFLQPFKIPTGSMQPTLNGITIRATQPRERTWWYRAVCLPLFGERVIHWVAEEDGVFNEVRPVSIPPLHYGGRRGFSNLLPMDATEVRVGFVKYLFPAGPQKFEEVLRASSPSGAPLLRPGQFFRKGETILDCVVQTGDQLFVDRFTYNFRKPRRGDVFVFETRDLPVPTPGEFYIKRLAGVPGDTLQIRDPDLHVNGAKITEPVGFARVMSLKDGYRGYTSHLPGQHWLRGPEATFQVKPSEYFAMGDNSFFSADSRFWGTVPYRNIVGRGYFVYWPFTRHFGRVE